MLKKFHPPRPDWYEEFYASVMNSATKDYEAEVFCSFFIFMDFFFELFQFSIIINKNESYFSKLLEKIKKKYD